MPKIEYTFYKVVNPGIYWVQECLFLLCFGMNPWYEFIS